MANPRVRIFESHRINSSLLFDTIGRESTPGRARLSKASSRAWRSISYDKDLLSHESSSFHYPLSPRRPPPPSPFSPSDVVLLICTYLSFSSHTRNTRTCARRESWGNGKRRKALSRTPPWYDAMNKTTMREENSQYRIRVRLIIGQMVTVNRSARQSVVIKLYECISLPHLHLIKCKRDAHLQYISLILYPQVLLQNAVRATFLDIIFGDLEEIYFAFYWNNLRAKNKIFSFSLYTHTHIHTHACMRARAREYVDVSTGKWHV